MAGEPQFSPGTTQTIGGLANGASYRFQVAAINSVGTGPDSTASTLAIPPFATPAAFVERETQNFLGRSATSDELLAEVTALDGGTPAAAFIAALRRSPDAITSVEPIARLYFAYFLRVPDKGGLAYWIGTTRSGRSLAAISNGFAASPQFKSRYGSLTNRQFVTLAYTNVFGRPGDGQGVSYWTSRLDSRVRTRGEVMSRFSDSSEYRRIEAPAVDVAVTWIEMSAASPGQTSFHSWVDDLTTGGKTVTDLAAFLLARDGIPG